MILIQTRITHKWCVYTYSCVYCQYGRLCYVEHKCFYRVVIYQTSKVNTGYVNTQVKYNITYNAQNYM